jgi:hypothetical protein
VSLPTVSGPKAEAATAELADRRNFRRVVVMVDLLFMRHREVMCRRYTINA